MSLMFRDNGNVVDVESGEIFNLENRVTVLGDLMKEMAARQALFDAENASMLESIEKLKSSIKNDVLNTKESLSYNGLNVVYSKGKTTWGSKGLNEYAKEHKELIQFKKTGNPVVAFSLKKEEILK